ncbi:MAG: 30S ribosome-binding factor RbfA [Acidimicrobiales bacterium]
MARPRQRAQARHQYNRTDRISETIREIVATELERLGDERVDLVTVTGVTVDNDLNTAKVFYSALTVEADGRLDGVADALEEIRWPIQRVVNGAIRARKTPQIEFLPDDVLAAALRIDDIINDRVHPAGAGVDADEPT